MYEIIASPEDYQIDHLVNGTGTGNIEIPAKDREDWAKEIKAFSEKINSLADRSIKLAEIFSSDQEISSTPASLKTLKIQLFTINDRLKNAIEIADKLESDIIQK
ncbi:MAG: hypothetical protein KAI40_06970 [Desulfobacterales bacterium]|nr:hypothetical protein [Desulfobacterales bacterium]